MISTWEDDLNQLGDFDYRLSLEVALRGYPLNLALLAGRDIAFRPSHDAARVDNIKSNKSEEHWQCVKAILICFVIRNGAVKTLCVLAETEDDSHLEGQDVSKISQWKIKTRKSRRRREDRGYDFHSAFFFPLLTVIRRMTMYRV